MGPDPPMERGGYVLITRDLHNIQFAMFSWRYPSDPVTGDYENRPFEVILGPFIRRFLSFQRC